MNDEDYTRLAAAGALRTYAQDRRHARRRRAYRTIALLLLSLAGILIIILISLAFPLPTP